jgi:hypothetical protein
MDPERSASRRFIISASEISAKKRIFNKSSYRSYAIAGYEAMHMIRKGQIRWLAKNDLLGQVTFIRTVFGIAA